MPLDQHEPARSLDSLSDLVAQLGEPAHPGSSATRRAPRWVLPVIVAVLIGLLAVSLPGILGRLGSALDPTSQVAHKLAAIPGIVKVGKSESRAGDLSFRNNVFFTVFAEPGLSSSGEDELADAVSATLAAVQGETRYLAELDLGTLSVGVSPVGGLNAARLELARGLAQGAGVVRTTVLWRTDGDDLIFDEDNHGLDVFVQAGDGAPLTLVDQAMPLLLTADDPTLTAIVLGPDSPRERLYSWDGRDRSALGEREVSIWTGQALDPAERQAISTLDSSGDVLGYRVSSPSATIALVEGVDVRRALDALSIPAGWEIWVSTAAGGDSWTREPDKTDPADVGWHLTEYG